MNRIINYINATLVSLDIPPLIKASKRSTNITKVHKISESISAEANK